MSAPTPSKPLMPQIPGLIYDSRDDGRGYVISIEGREGHGKSTLACLVNDPIAFINIDIGFGHIGWELIGDRKIARRDVVYMVPEGVKNDFEAKKVGPDGKSPLERFNDEIIVPLKDTLKRIADSKAFPWIVIDSGTELFTLLKISHHARIMQVGRNQYSVLNAEFGQMVSQLKDAGSNVILTHRLRPEYKDMVTQDKSGNNILDGVRTGNWEREGCSKLGYFCDAMIRTRRGEPDTDEAGKFWVKIVQAKENPSADGQEAESTGWTDWSELAWYLRPNREPETWCCAAK